MGIDGSVHRFLTLRFVALLACRHATSWSPALFRIITTLLGYSRSCRFVASGHCPPANSHSFAGHSSISTRSPPVDRLTAGPMFLLRANNTQLATTCILPPPLVPASGRSQAVGLHLPLTSIATSFSTDVSVQRGSELRVPRGRVSQKNRNPRGLNSSRLRLRLHTGRALCGRCLSVPAPARSCFLSPPAAFLLRFLVFPACGFGRIIGAGNQLYQGYRRRISMPPTNFPDGAIHRGS